MAICPRFAAYARRHNDDHIPTTNVRRRHRVDCSGRRRFSVMSWNILFENSQVDELFQFLATAPAQIVAIQEFTAEHVARIQHDQCWEVATRTRSLDSRLWRWHGTAQ